MRFSATMLFGLLVLAGTLPAEEKKKAETSERYGVAADLKTYPQGTPREALASVLKAIDAKRIDYVLAQLADPAFVDERVQRVFGGKFDQQVAETRAKLDPAAVRQLRQFHDKGEWSETKDRAVVSLKEVPDRRVHLKKVGARWYLEDQQKPAKE